jgi:hypothetical protein
VLAVQVVEVMAAVQLHNQPLELLAEKILEAALVVPEVLTDLIVVQTMVVKA